MGTLVESPSIKVKWDAFAEHGLERMTQRGVTTEGKTYSSSYFDENMTNIVNQLYGK